VTPTVSDWRNPENQTARTGSIMQIWWTFSESIAVLIDLRTRQAISRTAIDPLIALHVDIRAIF
jgi:hypothetical protein